MGKRNLKRKSLKQVGLPGESSGARTTLWAAFCFVCVLQKRGDKRESSAVSGDVLRLAQDWPVSHAKSGL